MSRIEDATEPEMDLTPSALSPRKNVVRRFYKDLWDKADVSVIPELFHEGFTFRGSLGPVLHGGAEFGDYVLWLNGVLANYTSDILELVEEGDRVSGKLRFHGHHRKTFFGCEPTGEKVWWYGAPIFCFEGEKIRDLWVLGDVYGLVRRMEKTQTGIEFQVA